MTARFAQIHFLTAYPANNLNRDDLGRPKSVVIGNTPRLRLSSQAVKRAWRVSDVMSAALAQMGEGVRSRAQWRLIGEELVAKGFAEAEVVRHLLPLRDAFVGVGKKSDSKDADDEAAEETPSAEAAPESKAKGKKKPAPAGLTILDSDLFFFNASDVAFIREKATQSLDKGGPTKGEPYDLKTLEPLVKALPQSGDVAMFGRMVAQQGELTIEGAVQVAHVFTVNKSIVDDDFFVAVDDLVTSGSAHMGSNAFGSGLYYGYVNIDMALLVRNLGGDVAKASALVTALVEAIATVAPTGKQNTFAARSYATFMLVETGNAQPRALADAFLTAVKGDNLAPTAVARLLAELDGINQAFPKQAFSAVTMDRTTGTGSLEELQAHLDAAFAA